MNDKDYNILHNLFCTGYTQSLGGIKTLKELASSPYINTFINKHDMPSGPFYRGLVLNKLPKVGDIFESNYSAWVLNKTLAHSFAGPSLPYNSELARVVVYTYDTSNLLLSFTSFINNLKEEFDETDIVYKAANIKIQKFMNEHGVHVQSEDELIMSPFKSKYKSIEKRHNQVYYMEV